MKKYGKITALIAGVVLALGFASCKADTDDDDDTSQPPAYYTVTFNSNGGTEVTSQKVESGKKATKPADPTKQATETETYTFDNWYTSTDGGANLSETAFDFDTAIKGDITLYAKWTVNAVTHTVTFDTKGGSTSPAEQTIVHGNKATKPAAPTKTETETEAFVFAGWYTSTDGGTTLSDTAFDFDTAIEGDITLYAKYDVYTIEYIELKNCSVIRTMFETLCEYYYDSSSYKYKFNKIITRFAKADARPEAAENYIDAAGNQIPLWYDEGKTTLYYYLEPGKKMTLRTSDGKNSLFKNMYYAVSIETGDFDTSKVTSMNYMFSECRALKSLDVSKFDTSNVTDMGYMFYGCNALKSLDVSKFDTSNVTDMGHMFYWCNVLTPLDVSKFDTSNVTDMGYMFYGCYALKSLDVSKFDTSKVTDMGYMFHECSALTSLDVSSFDTSKVTNMDSMFSGCKALTSLDLSKFDTSNVTDMSYMFYICYALTSLDLSKFDTSNVTDMGYMFDGCKALTSLDVSKFDTSNVTSMNCMFYNCQALTSLDVSSFDTSNVAYMYYMFSDCQALTSLDVSSFDTSNVIYMGYMFDDCKALITITASEKFVTDKVTDSNEMFAGCTSLKGGAGTVYDINHIDKEYARIDGGTGEPGYFTKKQ